MPSLNSQQENSLTAFMTALSQQDESLPSSLQAQLQSIGQNLENRVTELPAIAASLPNLNNAYQSALKDERTKSDQPSATLVSASNPDHNAELIEHAARILTNSDPVQAAQHDLSRVSGLMASNPLKRLFRKG